MIAWCINIKTSSRFDLISIFSLEIGQRLSNIYRILFFFLIILKVKPLEKAPALKKN